MAKVCFGGYRHFSYFNIGFCGRDGDSSYDVPFCFLGSTVMFFPTSKSNSYLGMQNIKVDSVF